MILNRAVILASAFLLLVSCSKSDDNDNTSGKPQQPPVAVNDTATTAQNTAVNINVLANDSDPNGDSLIVSAVGTAAHGQASLNSDNSIQYLPSANYVGGDSFTYTISDGNGGEASATVSITVTGTGGGGGGMNVAPTALNDSASTAINTAISINVLTNDSDPDSDVLTIVSTTQGSNGSVAIDAGNISVTYTPNSGYVGGDSFEYTISDGHNHQATATVTVTVTQTTTGSPPVAQNDSATTPQDVAVTIDVIANDSDPDGDTLTVVNVTLPLNGSTSISNNKVVYTPNTGFSGSDSFQYTISDGNGGQDSATVSVTVNGNPTQNTVPVALPDFASTTINTAVEIDVLANDSDSDGDQLTITSVGSTTYGSTVVINANNKITYTPKTDFVGSESFTYSITDSVHTVSSSVTVFVSSTNNFAPIAEDDSVALKAGTSVNFNVLINDTDFDQDALSVSSNTNVAHGTLVKNADGTFSYTPNNGYIGQDGFEYVVSDGKGGLDTGAVAITITTDPGVGPYLAYTSNNNLFAVEKGNPSVRVLITSELTNANWDNSRLIAAGAISGNTYTVQNPDLLIYSTANAIWKVDMAAGSSLVSQNVFTSTSTNICDLNIEEGVGIDQHLVFYSLGGPDNSCDLVDDNTYWMVQVSKTQNSAITDISNYTDNLHQLVVLRENLPSSGTVTGFITINNYVVRHYSADWSTNTLVTSAAQFSSINLDIGIGSPLGNSGGFLRVNKDLYWYNLGTKTMTASLFTYPSSSIGGNINLYCDASECFFTSNVQDPVSGTASYTLNRVAADGSASASPVAAIPGEVSNIRVAPNYVFIETYGSALISILRANGTVATLDNNVSSFIFIGVPHIYYNVNTFQGGQPKAVVRDLDGVVVKEIPDALWSSIQVGSLNINPLVWNLSYITLNNLTTNKVESWSWKQSVLSKNWDLGDLGNLYAVFGFGIGSGPMLGLGYSQKTASEIIWFDPAVANSYQQITNDVIWNSPL